MPLAASVKVYNTIVILIELYKCPTLLSLQNKDRFIFVSEKKETSDVKVFFAFFFLDLKNKQKSAKIIKVNVYHTKSSTYSILPQIKHVPTL